MNDIISSDIPDPLLDDEGRLIEPPLEPEAVLWAAIDAASAGLPVLLASLAHRRFAPQDAAHVEIFSLIICEELCDRLWARTERVLAGFIGDKDGAP